VKQKTLKKHFKKIKNKNIMETYLGTICVFGFNYTPYGWQYCNGQILPISSNAALFSLLGTYYGGNGTSTFGLPNLQGRTAIHEGQLTGGSLYTIGETSGVENVTVLISNMPAHAHSVSMAINANNSRQSSDSPVGAYPAPSVNNVNNYNSTPTNNVFMKPATVTLGTSGGSIPVSISDPSLVMNYCIAMQGIFPTRN
jgi:microcystin-dependent protein